MNKRWALAMVVVVPTLVGKMISSRREQRVRDQLAVLGAVCEGKGVEGAKDLVRGVSRYSTAVFSRDATERWRVDRDVQGDEINQPNQVDTVVCIDKRETIEVGACEIHRTKFGLKLGVDRVLKRKVTSLIVRLASAKSGRELARGTILGEQPLACDQFKGKKATEETFTGPGPGRDDLARWIQQTLGTGGREGNSL